MKNPVAILSAVVIAFACVLCWPVWLLVTGPLAQFVHPGFETYYGVFTIVLLCVSAIAGVLVGAWNVSYAEPRKHRHFHLRPLLHR